MSNELGFVYILTNPSMPGLVKIGKTTTTPSQRMSELHSTGVPTPFELECSISVADCHKSEKAAHVALAKHRVTSNREFFRVSVRIAIERILEVVDEYEVVHFRGTHGVERLETAVRQRKEAAAKEKAALILAEKERLQRATAAQQFHIQQLSRQLSVLKTQLAALGPRPQDGTPGLVSFLAMCFFPLPFGWIVWLGALSVFNNKNPEIGWFLVAVLVAGYFAFQHVDKQQKLVNKQSEPFYELDTKIRKVEEQLNAAGANLNTVSY